MSVIDWMPSTEMVGSVLRARTKDNDGNEIGDFNEATRPTGDQVQLLIDDATTDVAAVIGDNPGQAYWDRAMRVTAVGAALYVELGYFPEQVATGRSPYDRLKTLYDERLARLATDVAADPNETFDAGAASMMPVGSFDTPYPWPLPNYYEPYTRRRITWDTPW